jgi:hypothetical protein
MLGIVVIVLLVFFLYYYRPRNVETKFKQPIFWSEFAKGCFVCHPIFLLTYQCCYIIFLLFFGIYYQVYYTAPPNLLLYPFDNLGLIGTMISILWFVFPVFSAWLMHREIIEPLREEIVPKQNLMHLIGLTALTSYVVPLSMYLVQLFSYGTIENEYILKNMLDYIFYSLPFFAVLLIGIFAVEISRYKMIHI